MMTDDPKDLGPIRTAGLMLNQLLSHGGSTPIQTDHDIKAPIFRVCCSCCGWELAELLCGGEANNQGKRHLAESPSCKGAVEIRFRIPEMHGWLVQLE